MRVLITRPREDAEETAKLLEDRGIKVATESMLAIISVAAPDVSSEGVQALLFTSANGVRAMASALAERELLVYTVGDASARAARQLGYKHVHSAAGDVESLAKLVSDDLDPKDGALLHAAASTVAGDLKGLLAAHGFDVRKAKMYESRQSVALSDVLVEALKSASLDAIFFFSPRTAKTFVTLCSKAGVTETLKAVTAYGLSSAVADQLDANGWRKVRVAEHPDQDSLLAIFDQDRENGFIKARQAAISADMTKGGGEPMSSGDTTGSKNTDETKGPGSVNFVMAAPEPEPADVEADHDMEIDSDPEGPESSQPPTKSGGSGFGTFLILILLLVIAGLGGYASLPYWRDKVPQPYQSYLPEFPVSQSQAQMSALQATVDANSAELTRLNAALQTNATRGVSDEALAALKTRVEELGVQILDLANLPTAVEGKTSPPALNTAVRLRLEQLAGQVDDQSKAIAKFMETASGNAKSLKSDFEAYSKRLANVEDNRADASTVLKLSDRITDIEKLARTMASRHDASLANLLAVVQLRAKAADGLVFDAELRTARALSEDKAEFDALVGNFVPMAGQGVATTASLRTAYDVLSATAAKAAAAPQGDSLLDKTLGRVMGLVTVRRMDGKDDGKSVNALLARAESFLNAGDVSGAIQELEGIEAPAVVAVLKPWIERAQARVSLDAALSTLTSDALARVAGSAMQAEVRQPAKGE